MKVTIAILLINIIVFFGSCISWTKKTDAELKLYLTDNLMFIIDSLIQSNNNAKYYEVYIDRITSDSSVITLHSGDMPICYDENKILHISPILQMTSNKKKINVYCGIEKYIDREKGVIEDSLYNISSDNSETKDWIIISHHDKIRIDERRGAPFFTLPQGLKFPPPTLKK